MQTANNAGRKEIDWQGQYEALVDLRRLVKHHPSALGGTVLHEIVVASVPAIDALRSFTVKCAMLLYQVRVREWTARASSLPAGTIHSR